jgi:hypothetical protein
MARPVHIAQPSCTHKYAQHCVKTVTMSLIDVRDDGKTLAWAQGLFMHVQEHMRQGDKVAG